VARSAASDGSRPPIAQGVGYRPEPALADDLEHERARQQRPTATAETTSSLDGKTVLPHHIHWLALLEYRDAGAR
jgi:hypothetical protein